MKTPEGPQFIPMAQRVAAFGVPFAPFGGLPSMPLRVDLTLPHWQATNDPRPHLSPV